MNVLLKVTGLEVAYGPLRVVKGVDLQVDQGEIVAILGANGAGKSSIIRAILGLVKPRAGKIEFPEGKEIQGLPPHKVSQMGIAWVPQGREIFSTLTVHENLLMGAFNVRNGQQLEERLENVMELFPILKERRSQLGTFMSGGQQQMLAIGRALMCNPKLLLMDEPCLGLAPVVIGQLFELVKEIRERGISILIAETNARQALKVADRVSLLELGKVRASGPARNMETMHEIQRAYLGG